MKVFELLESPAKLSQKIVDSPIAKKHSDNMKKHFEELMTKKSDWEKEVKTFILKRVDESYILTNSDASALYYGLNFTKFADGITIKWVENYSDIRNLTQLIFTQIIKYDSHTKFIYSGDVHTPDSVGLHGDLKKFKQLDVVVWDDKKKEITDDDPYSGIYNTSKQFRFGLKEEYSGFIEDETRTSIFLKEGFEKTYLNLSHDLEFFIELFFSSESTKEGENDEL